MSSKKTISISDQLKRGADSLAKWKRGELKLRTTIVDTDGKRATSMMSRNDLDVRRKKAELIRSLRAQAGMSQPEFAKLIHVGSDALKQWETTRRAVPEHVLALASLAVSMPSVRTRLAAMDLNATLSP
jgi:DNA-binding transcriptional regulator YiaG